MITKTEPILRPLKAIRAKCLDCCCGQVSEVRQCVAKTCPLWALRTGHRPTHAAIAEARAALQNHHGGADLGATNAS